MFLDCCRFRMLPVDLDSIGIAVHVSPFDIVSCVFLICSGLSLCSPSRRGRPGMVSEMLVRAL